MDINLMPTYTMGNEAFAYFLDRASAKLGEKDVPHVLVGGAAVQAHVLDRMCRVQGKDVLGLDFGREREVSDVLRPTNIVDMALGFDEYNELVGVADTSDLRYLRRDTDDVVGRKILEFVESLEGSYPIGNHVFEYVLDNDRRGTQRIGFIYGVDDPENKRTERGATLKIERSSRDLTSSVQIDSEWYNIFVEEGVDLKIPYLDYSVSLRVLKPEYLLAVKIALDRAPDQMDVRNLIDAMKSTGELDGEEEQRVFAGTLREILCPFYAANLDYFGRMYEMHMGVKFGEEPEKTLIKKKTAKKKKPREKTTVKKKADPWAGKRKSKKAHEKKKKS
ncbi:MAG: hypothetical protein ABIH37_03155 [archaeon]